MLTIIIPATESFDENTEEFITTDEQTLQLEHSLVSISKWESKWCKPFLSSKDMTNEETLDYIKCMTLTENVDPKVYTHLTASNIDEINAYISAPMTATTFSKDKAGKNNKEIITSELIYYWMFSLNIPMECENWHLNRLLTVVRVCNVKNAPPKKTSMQERLTSNAQLNAERRKLLNSKG